VHPSALGKETDKRGHEWSLCQVLVSPALGKEVAFTEYHLIRLTTELVKGAHEELLCRVSVQRTLGKEGAFAECHSVGTRHRLRRRHLAPWRWFFFAKYRVTLGKVFAESPIKSTRQRIRWQCTVHRAFFAECHTRQSFCWVFFRLCRVLQTLGKEVVSGSTLSNYHRVSSHYFVFCHISAP
jgi:hypothetical protein